MTVDNSNKWHLSIGIIQRVWENILTLLDVTIEIIQDCNKSYETDPFYFILPHFQMILAVLPA